MDAMADCDKALAAAPDAAEVLGQPRFRAFPCGRPAGRALADYDAALKQNPKLASFLPFHARRG